MQAGKVVHKPFFHRDEYTKYHEYGHVFRWYINGTIAFAVSRSLIECYFVLFVRVGDCPNEMIQSISVALQDKHNAGG